MFCEKKIKSLFTLSPARDDVEENEKNNPKKKIKSKNRKEFFYLHFSNNL